MSVCLCVCVSVCLCACVCVCACMRMWLVLQIFIYCYFLGVGNFIYIRKPQNFSMDFQMPSTMTRDIKVCLYLRYLMPSRKSASLKIYLRCHHVTSLIFNLTGFHGHKWMGANVPFQSCIPAKVNVPKPQNILLLEIRISQMFRHPGIQRDYPEAEKGILLWQ